MAIKLEEMFSEVRYPSGITTAKNITATGNVTASGSITITGSVDTSGATSVVLPAGSVKGSYSSLTKNYATLVVATAGTGVAVNVFDVSAAPVSGSITGLYVVAGTATTGNVSVFSTTAGTIATVASGTALGWMSGTSVLTASVTAGDTVTVSSTTNNPATAFVVFKTAL